MHPQPALQSTTAHSLPEQVRNQLYLCDKAVKPHFICSREKDIGKAISRTRRVILKEMSRDRGREKRSFAYVSYEMGWKQGISSCLSVPARIQQFKQAPDLLITVPHRRSSPKESPGQHVGEAPAAGRGEMPPSSPPTSSCSIGTQTAPTKAHNPPQRRQVARCCLNHLSPLSQSKFKAFGGRFRAGRGHTLRSEQRLLSLCPF